MSMSNRYTVIFTALTMIISSLSGCVDQTDIAEEIPGCMDPDANNFVENATIEDDSCEFDIDAEEDIENNADSDTDNDGILDAEDNDDDGDGWSDEDEVNCLEGNDPMNASSFPTDTDGDGLCDAIDTDDDGDNFSDVDEIACMSNPLNMSEVPLDTDDNGVCDHLDSLNNPPTTWGNQSVRFIYEKLEPENNQNVEQAKPYYIEFSANPMAEQNPAHLEQICSKDDNFTKDVYSAHIFGDFPYEIISWKIYNANGIVLGMFVSNDNLSAEWMDMSYPTIISTQDKANQSNGHLEAMMTDMEQYECELDNDKSIDTDGDGLPDSLETSQYGTNPNNPDTDGDGLSDGFEVANGLDPLVPEQIDTDQDGFNDSEDLFPNDPSEWNDTDGDGLGDNTDAFPTDACAKDDTDGDGLPDNILDGENDPMPNCETDLIEDSDDDNDGIEDVDDVFPLDPNEHADYDQDGIGDNADSDDDGDGVDDVDDAFPLDPNESQDSDGDGVGDNTDQLPEDGNETLDSDGDGIGDNADLDDDGDTCDDVIDAFPLNNSECFDTDGDGIGDNEDSEPWINNGGNGSFTMDYTMVGVKRGHQIYWLGSAGDCPCYAYYHTTTPDQVWSDGARASVSYHEQMPNVDATLAAIGLSLDNLSVSTSPVNLGNDTQTEDWDYDSNTKIEWRIYSRNFSTLYLDDIPIFAINESMTIYLNYTGLMESWGSLPVTMWGHSTYGELIGLVPQNNIIAEQLYNAYVEDFGNGAINFEFETAASIIADDFVWGTELNPTPENATGWLIQVISDEETHAGLFGTINSTTYTEPDMNGVSGKSMPQVVNRAAIFLEYRQKDEEIEE